MVLRHLSNILCFLTWPNGIGNYLLQRVANIVPLESLQYIVYGPMHLSIVAIFGISELFCNNVLPQNILSGKGISSISKLMNSGSNHTSKSLAALHPIHVNKVSLGTSIGPHSSSSYSLMTSLAYLVLKYPTTP